MGNYVKELRQLKRLIMSAKDELGVRCIDDMQAFEEVRKKRTAIEQSFMQGDDEVSSGIVIGWLDVYMDERATLDGIACNDKFVRDIGKKISMIDKEIELAGRQQEHV